MYRKIQMYIGSHRGTPKDSREKLCSFDGNSFFFIFYPHPPLYMQIPIKPTQIYVDCAMMNF